MLKTFSMLFVMTGFAAAQPVGAGIKVGGLLNDILKVQSIPTFATFSAEANRLEVGPYVEIRLPAGMAVEADALYHSYAFSNAGIASTVRAWEFPLLLKHKLLAGPIKPYFEGGVSIGRLFNLQSVPNNHLTNYGVVVGGGVELHLLFFRLSPELRYNGWALRNFDSLAQSTRNQVSLLVGIGF